MEDDIKYQFEKIITLLEDIKIVKLADLKQKLQDIKDRLENIESKIQK
ncbi:MAG: hypothetical protein AAB724_00390 [Patescibacteria group bacterium]